jgi:catechol 2,3-dioxygenase-like lactoylglutathione lyase family enzyme
MLSTSKIMAFVATTQPAAAKRFYESILGLTLVDDSPFAIVFDSGGTTVRIQKVEKVAAAGYTTLGWQVADIATSVQRLSKQGVVFERYEGVPQDESGIWRTPDGSSVAWFRDPDGNTLSLTQHPTD